MKHPELIIVGLVIVGWIIRTIFRSIRWLIRQIQTVGVAPSPIQTAMAEAQRLQAAAPQSPRSEPAMRRMPRRPDAGGPLVPREATRADFDRSETELFALEPAPLRVPLRADTPATPSPSFQLFSTADDLVRAIILQEVLGPPHSKRASSAAQVSPTPPH